MQNVQSQVNDLDSELHVAVNQVANDVKDAVDAIGQIPQYIRPRSDGLYVTDGGANSVLKITSSAVTINTSQSDAAGYSQFAANYVQFGNYQLRRTSDNGLAFQWVTT